MILTSKAVDKPEVMLEEGITVHRKLFLEVEGGLRQTIRRLLWDRQRVEATNLDSVRQVITQFQPDIALIWGMWNVPITVAKLVEELLASRVAYYLCDYWLTLPSAYIQRWQEDAKHGYGRLPKRLLGKVFLAYLHKATPPVLLLEYPICVSRAIRDRLVEAGVAVEHAQIIYGGTQVEEFLAAAKDRVADPDQLRLIYLGRIVPEKGIHTIIQALVELFQQQTWPVTLNIFGSGDADYEAQLKQMVVENGLERQINFCGQVPRAQIPTVLARHDTLIFSSEWEEPFARTVLEAMAAGLVVIGTTTGGTAEILKDQVVGLTYPAGEPAALANQIRRLAGDAALRARLAKAGQDCVISNYTFNRMVDQLEAALERILGGASVSVGLPT
jgi:glycosyltransferase involved in cell wall biosynthesis